MYFKSNKWDRNWRNAWTPNWRIKSEGKMFKLDSPLFGVSVKFDFMSPRFSIEYCRNKDRYQGEALYKYGIQFDRFDGLRRVKFPEVSAGLYGGTWKPEGQMFTSAVASSGPHPNGFDLEFDLEDGIDFSHPPAGMTSTVLCGRVLPRKVYDLGVTHGPENRPKFWKGHLAAPTIEEIKSGEWKRKLDARNAQA